MNSIIKHTLGKSLKLAIGMVLAGSLITADLFFGTMNSGWFFEHRWYFVLMAVAGLALIAGYVLTLGTDSE